MTYKIAALLLICSTAKAQVSSHAPLQIKEQAPVQYTSLPDLQFSGYLGNKLDLVITHNIAKQDVEALIEPFRHRTETHLWQTEFWGKWMLSAVKAYEYNKDTALLAVMRRSTYEIMATQTPDGYIGNYTPDKRLQGWDVWGMKYTLLGLIYYYDITTDKNVLRSAEKLLDHAMTMLGPGKTNIVRTGSFRGMPSSSILEPVVLLYERTARAAYLDFAKYIVTQWETPDGPQLISKALQDIPVAARFDTPIKNWWAWENGRKAYEMMSCYDGLLKLYQVTGDSTYLQSVIHTVQSIKREEINIVGSGAALECWYGGNAKQFYSALRTMETCVTITWMKLCYELYRITGDPSLVDNIETSAYNNLLGSLSPDGSRFGKYSGLQGFRDYGEFQCGMEISCCMANGPRGLTLLPDLAIMHHGTDVCINLYNAGQASLKWADKHTLHIGLRTDYPLTDKVSLQIDPDVPLTSVISLRIPSWSSHTTIEVNGRPVTDSIAPGKYFTIKRTWNKGDIVVIRFDMELKQHIREDEFRQFAAYTSGPIVLARDSRFSSQPIDLEIATLDKTQPTKPLTLKNVFMAFDYTFITGNGENPVKITMPLIDFAAAGNEWNVADRYRVWTPVQLNVSKPPISHAP